MLHEPDDAGILAKWELFIAEVERGYRLTIYDFSNDLSLRNMLDNSTLRGNAEMCAKLDALDERYRNATREVASPLRATGPIDAWWRYRIPLLVTGELEQDLHADGYL